MSKPITHYAAGCAILAVAVLGAIPITAAPWWGFMLYAAAVAPVAVWVAFGLFDMSRR